MIGRIKKIIEHTGLSERAFAEIIGVKQNTLNQQLKGERGLSLETISKILISYENISAEWLLRGSGEMIKENNDNKEMPQSFDAKVEIDEEGCLKIKIKK